MQRQSDLEQGSGAMMTALTGMIYTPVAEEGDYHQDELLYCGTCRTPRQMLIDLFGDGEMHKVPVMCICQETKEEELKALDRERRERERVKAIRQLGLSNAKWLHSAFDLDDQRDRKASEVCKRYADNFDRMLEGNVGLMLYGAVGTGKTFLAACIANAVIDQGYGVVMDSLPALISEMGLGEEREAAMHRLSEADLLILDDVGVERGTEYGLEQAYSIIDKRYASGKPLVVTTNLTPQMMLNERGERMRYFDRIVEMCKPVAVQGQSRRIGIAQDKRKDAMQLLEGSDE